MLKKHNSFLWIRRTYEALQLADGGDLVVSEFEVLNVFVDHQMAQL